MNRYINLKYIKKKKKFIINLNDKNKSLNNKNNYTHTHIHTRMHVDVYKRQRSSGLGGDVEDPKEPPKGPHRKKYLSYVGSPVA